MTPAGSETQKKILPVIKTRDDNAAAERGVKREQRERDGCFSVSDKICNRLVRCVYQVVFMPLPVKSFALLVCSFIRRARLWRPPGLHAVRPSTTRPAEVQTAENVFEREKGKCDGADFALPAEKVVF
jgi:hypothetical protein